MYAPLAVDQFPGTCTVLEAISIEIHEIVIGKCFCILANQKVAILLYNRMTHIHCRTTTIIIEDHFCMTVHKKCSSWSDGSAGPDACD